MKVDSEFSTPTDRKLMVGRSPKYPFRDMAVGDSVFLAGKAGRVMSAASRTFAYRNRDYDFTSRNVCEDGVDGVRVWRVVRS